MKHRVLLEFSADTLPDDFLDQIAGRVYGHPAVDKKECTAAFVGDVLKDAERMRNAMLYALNQNQHGGHPLSNHWSAVLFNTLSSIDAAKDTQ